MTNNEALGYLLDVSFKFWTCPDHPDGTVTWDGGRATCDVCGQTNHPLDLPGVLQVLVVADVHDFDRYIKINNPDKIKLGAANFGKTQYLYASKPYLMRDFDPRYCRVLLLDHQSPNPDCRKEAKQLGYKFIPFLRHIKIDSWEPGAVFGGKHVFYPDGIDGDRCTEWVPKQVQQCPNDGTCSTKIAGTWYGNAEINDYVNHQRAWRPASGLFGLVATMKSNVAWERQEEYGWFRSRGFQLTINNLNFTTQRPIHRGLFLAPVLVQGEAGPEEKQAIVTAIIGDRDQEIKVPRVFLP